MKVKNANTIMKYAMMKMTASFAVASANGISPLFIFSASL